MRGILQSLSLFLLLAAASGAACSLVNAPADVDPGTGGGTTTAAPCTTVDDCPAPGPCKVFECEDGQCKEDQAPNNSPCDDGLFCTEGDFCASGECTGGPPKECEAPDDCHTAACDEATMACVVTAKRDGAICDDMDACTATSTCVGGVCVGGAGCPNDECVTSTCDPAVGCTTTPNSIGTPCGNTFCSTGQCDGQGKCVGVAQNIGEPCDDGLFCTTGEVCNDVGLCIGTGTPCQDPAVCVKAVCDEEADKCDFNAIPTGEPCEDGDVCTGGETCNAAAQCSGAQPTIVAFFETFAKGNAAGWELGPEWQIGKATASLGGNVCCDPAFDYDGDGLVAGVQLGGNAVVKPPDMPQHPFHYLTSPPIDASTVPGALYLTYYRWLLSDYKPYMHNSVEVSPDGGASWFVLWTYELEAVLNDGAWTFQSHDITAYKSDKLRFRFGFDIGQQGVYDVGSWNLDHIKVQNSACPQ